MLFFKNKIFLILIIIFILILSSCNRKSEFIDFKSILNQNSTYKVKKILDISDSEGTPQDIEIFNNYLFVSSSSKDKIRVYSIETKELVFEKTMWIAHGSSMQFSNEYYDENDYFPLLYVGGLNNFSIQVLRIICCEDSWDIVSVRIIRIDEKYGSFFSPSLNGNQMLALGIEKGSKSRSYVFLNFNLESMEKNDDVFSPTEINTFSFEYDGIYQGHKYFDDYMYGIFTKKKPNGNYWSTFVQIDFENKCIKNQIDFTPITMLEGEGIAFQIIDGKTKVYFSDTSFVYLIDFYTY